MRFTVTPLGSAGGRTVGQVVDDIVRYLEPRTANNPGVAPAVPSGDGPSSYYADRGTEAGRWLGYGAIEAGLSGGVDAPDFARVLAGRDPRTGGRLITARGSAGRRRTLGAGTETRRAPDGSALYGVADVAAWLRITHREVEGLISAGERAAQASLVTLLGGPPAHLEPAGSFLVPQIDKDRSRWITETELDRFEQARSLGTEPDEIASVGDPQDQLSLHDAARLAGVTTQYMRALCRRYQEHRNESAQALEDGGSPRRAYLVSYRGTKGQWIIKRGDLVAFLHRRAAPAVRVGYDLTLTTEKSLGVLGLLGSDEVRAAVLDAIEAGNDTGLAFLELRAASARRQGKPVLVRGWTVASFRHLTSRALDPFPHHHNVVANTVVDEHGTRRALDARGLYWHAQEASALATAEMRHRLTETLGVRWRPGRSGGWEIDGIGDQIVKEFSQRRTEIEDALAELEEAIGRRSTLDEVQQVVTKTRNPKKDVDPSGLVAGWWERARRLGLEPEDVQRCIGHPRPVSNLNRTQVFSDLASPDHGLCAGSSIFTRSEVLSALVNLPVPSGVGAPQPLLLPASDFERLADEFLASEHVIELLPEDLPATSSLARQPIFTTPEIVGVQQSILERFRTGAGQGVAVVSEATLTRALFAARDLTGEQGQLVRQFCTSGHKVQCAVGRAGAGKTTTMRVAADVWNADGFQVLGTAVKGEAARNLAEGAGIPTETVAWFLARRDAPVAPLDAKTVLIVDEASTLSDRDLEALLSLADRTGAAVRLVGDPAQHGAVAAGGMFRHLCESHSADTPELRVTHRMTDPADRAAAEALREGRIAEALDHLAGAGHLHIVDEDLSLYVDMLRRWWDARAEGHPHPMVDRRHRTRLQLNRLARRLLAADGQLGSEEIGASGGRAFAIGDEVVARMAARHLHPPGNPASYVRNGAVGKVVDLARGVAPAGDRLRIEFTGAGTVEVPRGFFDDHEGPGGRRDVGIDHAYAVTSYAIQGATYESSTSRIDEGASRSETYVDITRGRGSNHLFLTRAADPHDGEQLPKAPPPPMVESIAARLKASGPERTALEVDRVLSSSAQAPSDNGAVARRSTEIAGRRAARLARYDTPGPLLEHLPVRSELPHLARRWDDAVAAIRCYRERWKPIEGSGRWEWAVGPLTIDAAASAERETVIGKIVKLVEADAREQLSPREWSDLPAWAERHLAELAARGAGAIDPVGVSELYGRIARHRDRRGLTEDAGIESPHLAEALLGPVPDDPACRAEHRLLASEVARSAKDRGSCARQIG